MQSWLKRVEKFTDKSIPYWLGLLIILIIVEFFFKEIARDYHTFLVIADYIIVFFFVLDLLFKYDRMRKIKPFIKKYWLEIIAVFPFFLLFRLFEEIAVLFRFTREITEGQKFLHSGLELTKLAREERALLELAELEKESRLFKEISQGTKFARTQEFFRYFRLPRLVRAVPFYEAPIKQEVKKVEKKLWKQAHLEPKP